MSIEDTLSSIDASLKTLVQIAQTFGNASAELGKPDAPASKPRAKKVEVKAAKLLDGDPEGTRYFLIEKHNTVARVLPGETVPPIEGTTEVDGDVYLAKKEEFAKKSVTSGTQAEQSTRSAAGTTSTAPASDASSGAETVSFKAVVDALMVLSKDTRPNKGRAAITEFLAKHGKTRVPELEAIGKHADLLAEVNALLAPDAAPTEADPFA
jgi:hypothetical protein